MNRNCLLSSIYVSAIFLLLLGCNRDKAEDISFSKRNNSELKYYKVDLDERHVNLGIQYVMDSFQYVKLERTEDVFLTEISKVIWYDSSYFIFDDNGDEAIFQFDQQGTFIRKFDEFSEDFKGDLKVNDFDIDQINGLLSILDERNRIIVYDIENGAVIDQYESTEVRTRNILMEDSTFYIFSSGVCSGEYCSDFYKTSYSLDIEFADLPIRHQLRNQDYYIPGNLKKSGSSIYISSLFNDTIFQVRNNELIPSYYLDFNDYKTDLQDFRQNSLTDFIWTESKDGKTQGIEDYYITDNYVYFRFNYNASLYQGFFKKSQDDLIITKGFKTFKGNVLEMVIGVIPEKDILISSMSSEPLFEVKEQLKNYTNRLDTLNQLAQIALQSTADDNPLLILSHLNIK